MKYQICLGLILALAGPAMAQDADPVAGKTAFARCSSCHDVSAEPRNRMGPYLTGVVGRPAASVEGFTYSQAMMTARDNGLVWTPETLNDFIAGPHAYVPGTKMPNVPIMDETARADLIAYLISVSPDFDPATPPSADAPATQGTSPSNTAQ